MAQAAIEATPASSRASRATSTWLSAGSLIGPATIIVSVCLLIPICILFRYSLNRFEPRLMMSSVMPRRARSRRLVSWAGLSVMPSAGPVR